MPADGAARAQLELGAGRLRACPGAAELLARRPACSTPRPGGRRPGAACSPLARVQAPAPKLPLFLARREDASSRRPELLACRRRAGAARAAVPVLPLPPPAGLWGIYFFRDLRAGRGDSRHGATERPKRGGGVERPIGSSLVGWWLVSRPAGHD